MLEHISKEKIHHTNICVGNRQFILDDIDALLLNLSNDQTRIEKLVYEYDKFLIADAQYIFSVHLQKTAHNSMQIICLAFNSTNINTQNSILKMLEEPRSHTYFFIIVPTKQIILATVLSRAQIFEYQRIVSISDSTQKFIDSPMSHRLEYVKKICDDIKNEKISKQDVIESIEEVEKFAYEQKNINLLKKIISIKEYIKDQGASVKQLLEYLTLHI